MHHFLTLSGNINTVFKWFRVLFIFRTPLWQEYTQHCIPLFLLCSTHLLLIYITFQFIATIHFPQEITIYKVKDKRDRYVSTSTKYLTKFLHRGFQMQSKQKQMQNILFCKSRKTSKVTQITCPQLKGRGLNICHAEIVGSIYNLGKSAHDLNMCTSPSPYIESKT